MTSPQTLEPLAPGATLGKYQVERLLAVGGMAEIYLARVGGVGGFEKRVVLKRIIPRLATNPEFVDMFLDEARLTATLDHPNVIQVYDVDQIGGSYFFAMELVDGHDLASVLAECAKKKRGLTLAHAIYIVMQVAAGLHYAHDKKGRDGQPLGTVHRDVSPSNVMLTHDGQVKIVDFGIAKAVARQSKTKTGTIKGTINYMSPEQAQGHEIDRRSDVFSLGVLLYELTTGTRPFRAKNDFAVLYKIVHEGAPPPSERRPSYPAALEAIVMKALARAPEARYQTAEELRADLEGFARSQAHAASAQTLASFMAEIFDAPAADHPGTAPAAPTVGEMARPTATDSVVIPVERSRVWLLMLVLVLGGGALAAFVALSSHSGESPSASASAAASASVAVAPSVAPPAETTGSASAPAASVLLDASPPVERATPPRGKTPPHASETPVHERAPTSAPSAGKKWNLDSPLPP